MRSVVGIAFLALIAQATEEQVANTTAAVDDDADLETMLSNMDDETMDKVADKLIDKLLGNLTGLFNVDGKDLDSTELFKNLMPTDASAQPDRELTPEEQKQIEEQAVAEAEAASALAAAAAETAQVLAAAFQEAYNTQDADNQDGFQYQDLSQFLPEDQDSEVAPHAEDVCEGRDFNQAECQAQGAGCCFWENNACWAAIDGACEVATEEAPAELEEQADEQAPDLMTVIFVGLASVVMGSACTYALFKPRFSMMADKQLPLLTPA